MVQMLLEPDFTVPRNLNLQFDLENISDLEDDYLDEEWEDYDDNDDDSEGSDDDFENYDSQFAQEDLESMFAELSLSPRRPNNIENQVESNGDIVLLLTNVNENMIAIIDEAESLEDNFDSGYIIQRNNLDDTDSEVDSESTNSTFFSDSDIDLDENNNQHDCQALVKLGDLEIERKKKRKAEEADDEFIEGQINPQEKKKGTGKRSKLN